VELNRSLLAGFFEGTGHRLITAVNGREAVALAEKHRPDLVLMDMRMPEMNGYEATARIKSIAGLEKVPVIAVTASSFRDEEARARKACDGFLRKPFNGAELVAELKRFLQPRIRPETSAAAPPIRETTTVSPEARARRPAVLEKLRDEEVTLWPRLVRTMEMDAIEEFARRLEAGAREGGFPGLQKYAAKILEEVECFDVDHLTKTLAEFPAIRANLEQ
jgi:CheY-like chemotaxis protein